MKKNIGGVVLNYDYYNGKDEYSDGDVENTLLNIVKSQTEYSSVLAKTEEFAVYYHLSKEREFIIEPMHLNPDASVLEIGSGCGAVTGAIARKVKHVSCVELSERRSLINAYKNRNYNNIEILIGNYQDIVLPGKFDIITLIGVFEYASSYIHEDNPFETFLNNISEKLNQNGKIYIAIENRLGAKYFAGSKEDHAGREYEGIEGYPSFVKAKTFSYYELIQIFQKCGFQNYHFFYPYPDYKFPRYIFSDEYLPQKGDELETASNYTSIRNQYFDEVRFLKSLDMKKEFRFFSNSFLVCLSK